MFCESSFFNIDLHPRCFYIIWKLVIIKLTKFPVRCGFVAVRLNWGLSLFYHVAIFKNVVHSWKPGETPSYSASHQFKLCTTFLNIAKHFKRLVAVIFSIYLNSVLYWSWYCSGSWLLCTIQCVLLVLFPCIFYYDKRTCQRLLWQNFRWNSGKTYSCFL